MGKEKDTQEEVGIFVQNDSKQGITNEAKLTSTMTMLFLELAQPLNSILPCSSDGHILKLEREL